MHIKNKKHRSFLRCFRYGDRDRIQTCNRLIRSQLLYSVELRGRLIFYCGTKVCLFLYQTNFSITFLIFRRDIAT